MILEKRKPLIVGESNPYGSDSYFAMYPAPQGSAGQRLCELVLQLQPARYLRVFERQNLLSVPKWSVVRARGAAQVILDVDPDRALVLCGSKVQAAFGMSDHEVPSRVGNRVLIPHPSGLCRRWNEPGLREECRALVLELLEDTLNSSLPVSERA